MLSFLQQKQFSLDVCFSIHAILIQAANKYLLDDSYAQAPF